MRSTEGLSSGRARIDCNHPFGSWVSWLIVSRVFVIGRLRSSSIVFSYREQRATPFDLWDIAGNNSNENNSWQAENFRLTHRPVSAYSLAMPRGRKPANPPAAPAPASGPLDVNKLIADWQTAAKLASEAKLIEHSLRQQLAAHFFNDGKLEGTSSVDIGWGYQLKIERELAYNATNANNETTLLQAAVGAVNVELATALVNWKPELAKKAYRQVAVLAETHIEIKEAMAKAVTLKPGMPQLELVPPKVDDTVVIENIPA